MRIASLALIAAIALLHFYIAWFELFAQSVQMAANQGIYNSFLAIGLTWALFISDAAWQTKVAICFLMFVAIAGVVGAATVTIKTLALQTLPAIATLILVYLSRRSPDTI
ncbi:DUF1304 domain-containing protein [Rhodobacteraceae bacterium]|nr:DUF1304 domain-containing protein [Paracoccaceae bacterium]